MNQISFSFEQKITALREEWLLNPIDQQKSPDFWAVMNSISEQEAIKWISRLLDLNYKAKDLYNSMTYSRLDASDLNQLQSVLYEYKTNEQNIFYDGSYHKITKSQKFLLLFKIIKHWEHLEIHYII